MVRALIAGLRKTETVLMELRTRPPWKMVALAAYFLYENVRIVCGEKKGMHNALRRKKGKEEALQD